MLWKTLRVAAPLAAFLFVTICGHAQPPAKQNPDDKVLTALVNRMFDAQIRFDAETLEKIYAPDYIEVSPVGEVDVREKAIGFYKKPADAAKSAAPTLTTDEFTIRSYGKFAIVLVRLSFAPPGDAGTVRPPLRLRATVVCRMESKEWKIASVQTTGIRIRPGAQ